ncbi:uncharacterized protein [Lepeophtheirus salmonis]|uniref:Bromo domain-containing protein n=1 Tax=Lepeophtheirus salmonis TaxID=72036 RepID=A0A0K2UNM1_LEPSM|nr:bromodomain testis-specific protein-like [Lepeophtheirus salmonis]
MSMVLDPLGYSGRMREEEEEEEEEVDVESGGGDSMVMLLPPKDEKKLLTSQLQCIKIYLLEPLLRHPKSPAFRKPVDHIALGIPDYPNVITKPMDLGTVKEKIRTRKYAHYRDCVKDIELIWKNAKTFNPQDHFIHKIAIELEEFTKEKASKIDFQNCKYTDLPSNKRRKVSSTNNNRKVSLSNNNNINKSNSSIHSNHPKKVSNEKRQQQPQPTPPATNRQINLQKPPIDACREILEELVDSQIHSTYAAPFKKLPRGKLDLIKLRNRLRKGVYVHPLQVADDFRSIIARAYRHSKDEMSQSVQLASQLQHKFEVMFARRVCLEVPTKLDLTNSTIFTQTLLSAQDTMLSIQSNLQHLFTTFYMSKGHSNKKKKPIGKNKSNSKKSFKRPLQERNSPPKKKVKVEQSHPEPAKWTREEIIDLQTRIGQLDEHHQQPILSLMHKNGEKITEDEEGYVVLDIEEASSKSLSDIKDYINSLPAESSASKPPPVVSENVVKKEEEIKQSENESESSSDSEEDSSSDSSSEDSSDDD